MGLSILHQSSNKNTILYHSTNQKNSDKQTETSGESGSPFKRKFGSEVSKCESDEIQKREMTVSMRNSKPLFKYPNTFVEVRKISI